MPPVNASSPRSLIGKKAPAIILPNWDGEEFEYIPGASNRPVAVFFYPKSGTYGCTREACQFRDALTGNEVFRSANLHVIGISPDPVEKQAEFAQKQHLTYPVLSDAEGQARKEWCVGKGMFGLTESSRVTFVIDREGIVRDCVDNTMNFNAHAKFVAKWLKENPSQSKPPAATKTNKAVTPSATSSSAPAAPEQNPEPSVATVS